MQTSPLRAAWLAYMKAEFEKEWARDKESAEIICNARWMEYEKQLLLVGGRSGVTPAGELAPYDI